MLPDELLLQIADDLVAVPGVEAVVLGGSRARGTHHAGSDIDLGVYYDKARLALPALSEVVARTDDDGDAALAGPGGWGPWVDGGAWLRVHGIPVDLVLRDVRRVEEQCTRARRGEFASHPQPGHPLGFLDVSYAGEVATCRPLADPLGSVDRLRSSVHPYPAALTGAMVANLWQAELLVAAARKGLPKEDVPYVALCCSTALMLCAHAWHAAAGVWVLNEKGVVPDVARLPLATDGFAERARDAVAVLGRTPAHLSGCVDATEELVISTRAALDGMPSTAGPAVVAQPPRGA